MLALQILAALAPERPAPLAPSMWSKVAVHESGVGAQACVAAGPTAALKIGGGTWQVVSVLAGHKTDEVEIVATPEGFLALCNDRSNYNQFGAYMTVRARRFTASGAFIGSDFQVNDNAAEDGSAWRPLAAVRCDGLVAIAWTQGWDNLGYLRLMNPDGSWVGPSFPIGENPNGDQEDPAICWLPSGELFAVWSDFHAAGLGLELMFRVWSAATHDWLASPARLIASGLSGDQRWPTCRLGPDGQPWVAFEDPSGVWVARLLEGSQPSFQPQLLGPGRLPELAPPYVVFQNAGDVWLQNAIGGAPAQLANLDTVGDQKRPSAALGPYGTLWVAWEGNSRAWVRGFRP